MSLHSKRPRGLGMRARSIGRVFRRIIWTLGFFKFVDTTVINHQAVPKKGAVIVAANHTSYLDIVFLWGALRRQGVFIAMAELWGWPVIGWLAKTTGQIPVIRGDHSSGAEAITAAEKVLEHDGLFIIFPEGRISTRNLAFPYKPGVSALAMKTGVCVVPVGLKGVNNVLPVARDRTGKKKFFREEKVTVKFGEPLNPAGFASQDELLLELQRQIEKLSS